MTTQRSEVSHVSNVTDMRVLIKKIIKNVLEKKDKKIVNTILNPNKVNDLI